jgi:hypothetical protein
MRDSITKSSGPKTGWKRVVVVTINQSQAVRRQSLERVVSVTLEDNRAVRRQSLERVVSVILEANQDV